MRANQLNFHVKLLNILYMVVHTLKSVDETPACDHSNENY